MGVVGGCCGGPPMPGVWPLVTFSGGVLWMCRGGPVGMLWGCRWGPVGVLVSKLEVHSGHALLLQHLQQLLIGRPVSYRVCCSALDVLYLFCFHFYSIFWTVYVAFLVV